MYKAWQFYNKMTRVTDVEIVAFTIVLKEAFIKKLPQTSLAYSMTLIGVKFNDTSQTGELLLPHTVTLASSTTRHQNALNSKSDILHL